jgi:peptide/nickel transport system permease protein
VVDLVVEFQGPRRVVDGVSFDVNQGETLGLVGETGCGKTITALAVIGLLPAGGQVERGHCWFDGDDLVQLDVSALRRIRGSEIALVSQNAIGSLDPVFTVGSQLAEVVRLYEPDASRAQLRARVHELLTMVKLPAAADVARRYPHELSGGMAQRVAIAAALAGRPRLLIADEPTTALDVTVQAGILDLLRSLQHQTGMAILLITHDWGVVADICERAIIMYAGQVVEEAEVDELFSLPLHPYTEGLLHSNPHLGRARQRLNAIPGTIPGPGRWPRGCRFHPRCTYATAECQLHPIELVKEDAGRLARCIHSDKLRPTAAVR